jgi:arsenate reductase (thioredoxin)
VTQFVGQEFDYVISVCARASETCVAWPTSREQIRWHFDDPADAGGLFLLLGVILIRV